MFDKVDCLYSLYTSQYYKTIKAQAQANATITHSTFPHPAISFFRIELSFPILASPLPLSLSL